MLQFLASSPRGLSDLLARELTGLGAEEVRERSTGVAFSGPLAVAYRACLWSRLGSRVFLELARFEAGDADAFYAAAREIDWSSHLGAGATLACDFTGRHPSIIHSHFGALRLKDAIVDSVRDSSGMRPDIQLDRPGVRVHAHAHGTSLTISLDLSGEGLHRRGYRGAAGEAPLKENVAAGMLVRSGWPELAAQGAQFLDPMCGSGTLVIEAALIAADRAPGLLRNYFGFLGWQGHDAHLWKELLDEAQARARASVPSGLIRGQDRDATAIRASRENALRARVEGITRFEVKPLAAAAPLAPEQNSGTPHADAGRATAGDPEQHAAAAPLGLLCVNPPYGVRLQDHEAARATHRELGAVLRDRFQGWSAAVLIGAPDLGKELGLRAHRTHALWNGSIECRLLRLRIEPQSEREPGRFSRAERLRDSPGALMFANRLGKNLKRLQGWAARNDIGAYRLYDADMPEYAFAIDLYHTIEPDSSWLYVQEYAAPAEIGLDAVRRRRGEAMSVLADVTGVAPEHIRVRIRRRTQRGEQYDKLDDLGHFHLVREGGLRLRVNFDDYLDTGLFLDHRLTRERLRAAASGKRFLNLFAYTGTATVYAASGGASASTTVDMSRTYLEWAQRNLEENGFWGDTHELVRADCREWLAQSAREDRRYDLIFLDPPTFSNSKRMEGVLDIERDHPALIEGCAQLLAPHGLIVFSSNAQRFRLDPQVSERFSVKDVSAATIPKDFERNPRIHRCFEIRQPS